MLCNGKQHYRGHRIVRLGGSTPRPSCWSGLLLGLDSRELGWVAFPCRGKSSRSRFHLNAMIRRVSICQCHKGISMSRERTGDFTRHEEVGFAKSSCTSAHCIIHKSHCIDRALGCLIITESIDVKLCDEHTIEVFQFRPDRRMPLSKAILNGSELGQLTSPIRKHAECFSIA